MSTDTTTGSTGSTEPANALPPFGVDRAEIEAVLLATPDNPIWYEGYCEVARLTHDQIGYVADHCWDCSRAFGSNNTSIVVARTDEESVDPFDTLYYFHPGCWSDRTRNWGEPWTIPDGPITWRASGPRPGRATEGNIGTDTEGTVTILAHGEPLIGIDLRAGTAFTWPDGEQHVVIARFTPTP